jgi:aromatic ring hydroxylase
MGRSGGSEPSFDAGEHQVTHHLAAYPAGRSVPGDDLPVTRVDREGDADHLAVPATDLQLSNAMANNPQPWNGDAVLPDLAAAHAYRVFGPDSWPRIKDIVQKTVTSALIYLPSSVRDFANPAIDEQLRRYVRGSRDIGHVERIKVMKLLWDAVSTEFAGRHELYERNYSGG